MNSFLERAKRKASIRKPKLTERRPKKKNSKKQTNTKETGYVAPGAIYVGNIPHGFYEEQLKGYFSQFGKVTRVHVARSSKTGGCKGYAFVQFTVEDVAKIAAKAMHNYLFYEKLLKCHFIPAKQMGSRVRIGWEPGMKLACEEHRKKYKHGCLKSEDTVAKSKKRRLKKIRKLKKTLKEQDIEFEFNTDM